MKEGSDPKGGVELDVICVEIVGATLVARAVKELLQAQAGFDVMGDASSPRPGPQIVLVLGQDGIAVLKRRQLRSVRRRRQERFALITNGMGIDFCLARDLPIRVFIGTDDSIPVFLQGLRAAAAGVNFCSPQIVPFLLAAASVSGGNALAASGALPAAVVAPLRNVARDRTAKLPVSRPAISTTAKGGAISEEMWRATQQGLSDREAEIALQAAQGLSNQQIADVANVTLSTVKFHLYRVYQKLGIKRRSQLSQLTSPTEHETLV